MLTQSLSLFTIQDNLQNTHERKGNVVIKLEYCRIVLPRVNTTSFSVVVIST